MDPIRLEGICKSVYYEEKAWKAVYDENFANKGRYEPWTSENYTGEFDNWESRCLYQFRRNKDGHRLRYADSKTTVGLKFAAAFWHWKFLEEDEGIPKTEGESSKDGEGISTIEDDEHARNVRSTMDQTCCTKEQAESALREYRGDVEAAILSLVD
jgi:NACalpha-BTF3-like transcription factor